MNVMIGTGRENARRLAALPPLLLAAACGAAPDAAEPAAPEQPYILGADDVDPIPLAACARDPGDGLSPDKRSLIAAIAAFASKGYAIHQVSPTELTVYTEFRAIRDLQVGWKAQFGGDGSGELRVPETMPPQAQPAVKRIREWGRGVAGAFDKLKCRPAEELRRRCEKTGFSF